MVNTRRKQARNEAVHVDVPIDSPTVQYNDELVIDDQDEPGPSGASEGKTSIKSIKTTSSQDSQQLLSASTLDAIADIFASSKGETKVGSRASANADVKKKNLAASVMTWKPDLTLPQQNLDAGVDVTGPSFLAAYRTPQATTAKKATPSKKEVSKEWFALPTQKITDELKADLRVLRLRSAFDTKRFYRKDDSTKFPTQFHVGRVVEHAADFYSGRLTKKQRKTTMAEEIMHDEYLSAVRKKRFNKIQDEATYWSKKANKGRKTNNPRIKKKPGRKKH